MTRGRTLVLLAVGMALAVPAAAHWLAPEEIVAALNAPAVREAVGVTGASRDAHAPRLLVIRVGARWYDLGAPLRRVQVRDWTELWRHNVPQGIVAVLDDHTARPVVRFDATGAVAAVDDRPPGS